MFKKYFSHSFLGSYSIRILNRYRRFNAGMRIVIFHGEIFKNEIVNIGFGWINYHCWKRSRFAGQLELNLVKVVVVNVRGA